MVDLAGVEALLVEPDPILELEANKRWMAQVYGKVREESGLLFRSVFDALVKLAVRGRDYEGLATLDVDLRVERLVDLCPEHVRIIIATRTDPSFRLGRLRVRGQLTEIRAADLRFDPEEAAELLATPLLDREMLRTLCDRHGRKPGSGSTMPMLPAMGSTMTQAISSAQRPKASDTASRSL